MTGLLSIKKKVGWSTVDKRGKKTIKI